MSLKYAYGYIRVSTHDQEEISPDSQEHLLRDYAAKNNIVILKIFTDLGISGRKADKRPGFQEMIGLAKGSIIRLTASWCGNSVGSPGIRKSPLCINLF